MQKSSIRIGFIVVLLFASVMLKGQQPFIRQFTVDDGLPSSETYHVIQDSKGYIWVATNQGVSRFDGKAFRNFDIQDGLPESTTFEIYEDELSRIWFVSYPFQLSYFYNDSIHSYKYNNLLREISGHGLVPIKKSFRVEADDDVYFSFMTDRKIYKVDKKGRLKIVNIITDTISSISIFRIGDQLLSAQNRYTATTFLRVKLVTESYGLRIENIFQKKYSFGNFITALSKENQVLVAINNFIIIINPDKTYKIAEVGGRVHWLSIDRYGYVWIGKEQAGAEKYDINNIEKGPIESYLPDKSVSSVFTDESGGEWFSTLESGLYYSPVKGISSYNTQNGLSSNKINAVEVFDNKVYLGTYNGFIDVVENDRIIKNIEFSKNIRINALEAYKNEKLWIATENYLYSYNGRSVKKYINNHDVILNSGIQSNKVFGIKDLHPAEKDKVMLAQLKSFSIISKGKVVYDSYLDDNLAVRIEAIELLNDSTYLLGAFNGLWKYSDSGLEYLSRDYEMLQQRITDILVLSNPDCQILGTKGSGLIIRNGKHISNITEEEGLSSNTVTSLLRIDDEIWIGTNNGINVIKINQLQDHSPFIRVLKRQHGLISDEINEISYYNNKVYIGSNGGLTIIDKSIYSPVAIAPQIYIEKVVVDTMEFVNTDQLNLKYNQNFIKILISAIDFRFAANLKYQYRLVGVSNQWSTTNNTSIDFSFLPTGKYIFEVRAVNSDRKTSDPVSINIIIKPPFWETWWFLVIIFVTSVFFIYVSVKYLILHLRRQHQLQNDIYRYRQEALIRQMDPHFVFNTLNSIQSFVIRNDCMTSSIYLTKFSKLMRMILNNSQKQAVTLKEEIDSLNLYMEIESIRFVTQFTYSIEVEPGIDTDFIQIPAFVIQPFIENSIWHGMVNLKERSGNIYTEIRKADKYLQVVVEDNGVGRKRAEEIKSRLDEGKKSYGLSIVESRLSLLCRKLEVPKRLEFIDLYDDKGNPAGTRVTINIPIIN